MKRKLIILFLTVAVLTVVFSMSVFAATAKIVMNDPTVALGKSVTVSATVSGSTGVAGYDIVASYDTSKLSFSSASGDGNFSCIDNGGALTIHSDLSSGAGNMRFSIVFKTLSSGTTKLNVLRGEMFDNDGERMDATSLGYSEIKITPPPTASNDASLKGLSVSPGTLSPDFSSGVTEYSVTVGKDVSELVVSADKNNSAASVKVSGASGLEIGENTVKVTVIAEDGTSKVYTVNVKKEAFSVPVGNESEATIIINNDTEVFCIATIDESQIPQGFEKTEITIKEYKIEAIKPIFSDRKAVLVQNSALAIDNFFFYDESNGKGTPFEYFEHGGIRIVLLDTPEEKIPAKYVTGIVDIDEVNRNVLLSTETETPEFCLIYGINMTGNEQLYVFDMTEKTLQRFGILDIVPDTNNTPAETGKTADTEEEKDKSINYTLALQIAIPVIVAAIIVMIIVSVIQNRRGNDEDSSYTNSKKLKKSRDEEAVEQNSDITDSFEDDGEIEYVEDEYFQFEESEEEKEENTYRK